MAVRTKRANGEDKQRYIQRYKKLSDTKATLELLKSRKSPVASDMLTHEGNSAMHKLLHIYNHNYTLGTLPQTVRHRKRTREEAAMIHILKKGKNPKASATMPSALPVESRRPQTRL